MNKTWIFDIDGTLSDSSGRKHYVEKKPKNWDAWNAEMGNDSSHRDIVEFTHFAKLRGINVVICTGRGEEYRDVTERWLIKQGVYYQQLYMRSANDRRNDDIVKEEMLDKIYEDGYNPILVFDDRNRVVDMWRRNGIRCFQVAAGDF